MTILQILADIKPLYDCLLIIISIADIFATIGALRTDLPNDLSITSVFVWIRAKQVVETLIAFNIDNIWNSLQLFCAFGESFDFFHKRDGLVVSASMRCIKFL